jgi:hypothetical protein
VQDPAGALGPWNGLQSHSNKALPCGSSGIGRYLFDRTLSLRLLAKDMIGKTESCFPCSFLKVKEKEREREKMEENYLFNNLKFNDEIQVW